MSIEPIAAEETVDGLPVLAEVRALEPVAPRPPLLPAQAAAVAATSFVAGAATLAVMHRRKARKLVRGGRGRRAGKDVLKVVSSSSFLVDIHLLERK